MGRRREAREAAVQCLFAREMQGSLAGGEDEAFWGLHMARPAARSHAKKLVHGVLQYREEIDQLIQGTVANYRLERLANVDRNILRVAVYELLHTPEVPVPVVLNEAIEIARKFGAGESSAFVNGILDRIATQLRSASGTDQPVAGSKTQIAE